MNSTDSIDGDDAGRASSFFSAGAERNDTGAVAVNYPDHGPGVSVGEQLSLVLEASGVIGWWDWDVPSDRLYAGRRFADLYGVDPEDAARGAHLASFLEGIDPRDRDRVGSAVQTAVEECGPFLEEYRIARRDHGNYRPLWVAASGRCYGDESGQAVRFPGVIIDITERKTADRRRQALTELGDRLRDLPDTEHIIRAATDIVADVLSPSRVGFGIVDHTAETVFIPPEWRRADTSSVSGTHHFRSYGTFMDDLKSDRLVFIEDVRTDPRTAETKDALLDLDIHVLLNVPIIEHGRLVLVLFAHNDEPVDWDEEDRNFAHAVADRVQVALARLRAESQREMLNRELSHRLKNSLAMAQSIVSQSLRAAADMKSAKEDVGRRLSALGRAHEVLLSGSSEQADMGTVVHNALSPLRDDPERLHYDGPSLALCASAALSLSLILHELATNAMKHGALSGDKGQVDLNWRVEAGEPEKLVLRWEEKGGPPVSEPERRGFGSRLIRYGITGATDQSVMIDYATSGLICELSVCLSDVAADPMQSPSLDAAVGRTASSI